MTLAQPEARRIKVPDYAFKNFKEMQCCPHYVDLLNRMAVLSGIHKKKLNRRFYFGAIPMACVGSLVIRSAFAIAAVAITGTEPSYLVLAGASICGYLASLCGAAVVTGAHKHCKILKRMRKPLLVIQNHSRCDWNAPVPDVVKNAVRDFEKIEDDISPVLPQAENTKQSNGVEYKRYG